MSQSVKEFVRQSGMDIRSPDSNSNNNFARELEEDMLKKQDRMARREEIARGQQFFREPTRPELVRRPPTGPPPGSGDDEAREEGDESRPGGEEQKESASGARGDTADEPLSPGETLEELPPAGGGPRPVRKAGQSQDRRRWGAW